MYYNWMKINRLVGIITNVVDSDRNKEYIGFTMMYISMFVNCSK